MGNLKKVKSLLRKSFLIILTFCVCTVFAAPAPIEGLKFDNKQPDGTPIDVRVFGDDFFGYFATADGYTVVKDKSDNFWYYAEASSDGSEMVSTGKKVVLNLPATRGISKRNLPNKTTIKKIREKKYNETYSKEYLQGLLENKIQRLRNNGVPDAELKPLLDQYRSKYMPATRNNSIPDVPNFAPPPVFKNKKIVGLVILVEFSDVPASINKKATRAQISNMLNEIDYSCINDHANGNIHKGSLRDYYYHQSNGNVELTNVVNQYIKAPKTRKQYVADKENGGKMFVNDILGELRKSTTNIPDLDKVTEMGENGEDGIALTFLFAGNLKDIEWNESLWPHASYTSLKGQRLKGKKLCGYQMTDIGIGDISIGTLAHEMGHLVFKFSDYYDYGQDDVESSGLGVHCLMAAGNEINSGCIPAPINPYLRASIGWAEIKDEHIITVNEKSTYSLNSKNRDVLKYKSQKINEYFLIEARDSEGDIYQKSLLEHLLLNGEFPQDGAVRGLGGISIWHVDEFATVGTDYEPNEMQDRTPARHYECSLEQADGLFSLERTHANQGNLGDFSDYYAARASFDNPPQITPVTIFSSTTTPNSKWWNDSFSDLHLINMEYTQQGIYELSTVISTTMSIFPLNFTVGVDAGFVEATIKNEGIGNFSWDFAKLPEWIEKIEIPVDGASLNEEESTTIKIYYKEASDKGIIRSGRINISATPATIKNPTASITLIQRLDVFDPMDDLISGANLLTLPETTQELTIGNGDNVDWFKFDLTEGINYLFESISSTSVDVRAELYGTDKTVLLTKDDDGSAEFKQFKIAYTPKASGTYYLKVMPYINAYGSYKIKCSQEAAPSREVFPTNFSVKDTNISKVFTITSSKDESFSIEKENSANWISMTPLKGNLIAGVPTKVTVSFANNSDVSNRSEKLNITIGSNNIFSVSLDQMGLIPVGDSFDPKDDKIEGATTITGISTSAGTTAERFIGNGDNGDWFKFSLTKGTKYRFYSTSSTNVDIRAELFRQKPANEGSALVSVASDDDSLSLQFNIIYTALEGGIHYLKITPYSSLIYGDYKLIYSSFNKAASSRGEMIISSKSGNVNSRGATKSFVIANIGDESFTWNISQKPDWVTSISPINGMLASGASEIINYSCDSVAENSIARTGIIVISSDTPNVIGAPKNINISQDSQISDKNTNSIVYNIKAGWNLISVPLINPDMMEFKKICDETFWVWQNNDYKIVNAEKNTEYLKAFWIFANSDTIITLSGERIPPIEVELAAGWNLYGPTENMILPTNIETIFSWDPAGKYEEPAGALLEGKGYWIFVPEKTLITL